MKSLIVCVSKSHGNTRRVADRMAEVLGAEVIEPESADPEKFRGYDLVGFGSGIYYMAFDARLRDLIRRLPQVDGVRALPLVNYTAPTRKALSAKGFEVLDSFSCRGFDTVGPFGLIGGINRGRPDGRDLDRAAAFAQHLHKRITGSSAAS